MSCFKRLSFLTISFILLNFIFSLGIPAAAQSTKTIRVGYPIQHGLTSVDESGQYSGYTYDYLMELSQYTGWKYEFFTPPGDINQQLLTCLDMLKNGELDLIGGMNFSESLSEVYSYPGYSYGTNYFGIFVPDDSELTESSLYSSKSIRVAVHDSTLQEHPKLLQFAQMNNLNIEQVVMASYGEFLNAIPSKRADALLSSDLSLLDHNKMRAIAHFSPAPFYFATTKGNSDVVMKLDYAISTINKINPNFAIELYNKYFSSSSSAINLSEDEKRYINNCGTLEVVMYKNKPPFQYIDSATGEVRGITSEVLNMISEATGLTFRYNLVSTYQEYLDFTSSGRADIAADTFLNYQDAADFNSKLTLPWHSLPIYVLFNEEAYLREDGRIAAPYFLKNILKSTENITFYDTVLECLQAVRDKKADYCYVGEFCSQYYLNSGEFSGLKFLNQSDSMTQKLSFGICNDTDFYLLSIFNKCITSLPSEKIDEIIYRNTYLPHPVTFSSFIRASKDFLIISGLILLLAAFLIYVYIKNQRQRQIAFENSRYNTLSNLTNEYFYEYDMMHDELVLPEKCAEYFRCDKNIKGYSKKLSSIPQDERTGIWQLGEYIVSAVEGSSEISCLMPSSEQKWYKITSSLVYSPQKHIYAIGKISDIHDIKSEQIRLEQKSSMDGLTGIYNIAAIKRIIGARLEENNDLSPCAMIILDIDNFKQINDHHGHYTGDTILIQVANLISGVFHPNPVGRLGGDEFVAFYENADVQELKEKCQSVCESIAEITQSILKEKFTISIGVAFVSDDKSYEELYRRADDALYRTKSRDKNGFTIYEH